MVIEIDEAIEVSPERERGAALDPLMAILEQRLQGMLDRLSLESPLYEPKRFPATTEQASAGAGGQAVK